MARTLNGILGGLSGKIGPVIASSRNGVFYLKATHSKRTSKPTAKEKANRRKFSAAQKWLTPILPVVRRGFKGYTPAVQGFIAAKSYLMKNAMDSKGIINPALVKISYGKLPLSNNITVKLTPEKVLEFNWDSNGNEDHQDDQVMLLAYNIKENIPVYTIAGEFRSKGNAILHAQFLKGNSYHIYVAFVAEDRSSQSDSVYLGEVKF
jgi:hypothetical protein